MNTRLITVSAIVAAALVLAGCSSGTSAGGDPSCTPEDTFSTVKEGALTVGVSDMPPQSSTTGENGMSGTDADLIELFAKQECLAITVSQGTSGTMIPSVQQGRADVALGGWNRTKERSKIVGLSDPLYVDPLAIISENGTDTIAGLEGETVGTVDGYNYVPSLQAVFGDKLKLYPTPLELSKDLEAGRIAAAIDGGIAASLAYDTERFHVAVAKKDERVPATVEAAQGALVFNIENVEILKAFNSFLAVAREDGTLAKILEKYDVPAAALDTGDPRLI